MKNLLELIENELEFFVKNLDNINVEVESDDDSVTITATINEEGPKMTIVKEFEDYLDTLSDDFFIQVCESIGEDKLKELDNVIENSDDLDEVTTAINKIRMVICEEASKNYNEITNEVVTLNNKINELNTMRKTYEEVIKENSNF